MQEKRNDQLEWLRATVVLRFDQKLKPNNFLPDSTFHNLSIDLKFMVVTL